jgi:hypothetical protein
LQPIRKQPRDHIGRRSRTERHDDLDRPVRPFLGKAGCQPEPKAEERKGD